MKITIYSLTDVYYYSYYIKGFYLKYGKDNVKFSVEGFPSFPERSFAAKLENGESTLKIAIDAFDSPRIPEKLLDWCDILGKVNFDSNQIPKNGILKVIPIGPSFGIKIWNLKDTLIFSVGNYLKNRRTIRFKREFFANYWRQYKRLPLEIYYKSTGAKNGYIFFTSSLWEKEEVTNCSRDKFMNACREMEEVTFEGGFAPRTDGKDLGFRNFTKKRIHLSTYLNGIEKSVLTFNTPAVQACHGWKLAEFLALGKAIISTPLTNEMPQGLFHGHSIHFVDQELEEIKEAIREINNNLEYREKLEKNAREFFEEHLKPEAVIDKLVPDKFPSE